MVVSNAPRMARLPDVYFNFIPEVASAIKPRRTESYYQLRHAVHRSASPNTNTAKQHAAPKSMGLFALHDLTPLLEPARHGITERQTKSEGSATQQAPMTWSIKETAPHLLHVLALLVDVALIPAAPRHVCLLVPAPEARGARKARGKRQLCSNHRMLAASSQDVYIERIWHRGVAPPSGDLHHARLTC